MMSVRPSVHSSVYLSVCLSPIVLHKSNYSLDHSPVSRSLQILSTVGASAFTFVSMAGGRDLLVAANGGSPGNREVNSIIYQFTSAGQLEVVRRERGS